MKKETPFAKYLQEVFINEFVPMWYRDHGEAPDDRDFADHLKLSDQAYSHYKLGKRRPTIDVVERIADILKDPRAYDAAGYPRRMPKDPLSILFVDNVHLLTDDEKKEIKEMIQRRKEETEARRNRRTNTNAFA